MATATTRDNAESVGSAQIHMHCALEKLVPKDWKQWQYQFGVATHGYSDENGALLENVEHMEVDEVFTQTQDFPLSQEQSQ